MAQGVESARMKRKDYEKELRQLQVKLCHLQEFVKAKKLRVIILIKLWLEVGMEEQERRFRARIDEPLRQWKLSPMDTESYRLWYDYSRARDMMLKTTSSKHAPWTLIRSDDKRRARLNCISHL